jgi:hypothetical protein
MKIDIKNDYIKAKFPNDFDVEKYTDKKIIIVGGGPTTNDINWQNLDYDFIFSCNQYYLCDKMITDKIDLITLINRMNFLDEGLQQRLDRDNTFVGIEPHHSNGIYNTDKFKKFIDKYENKCIFFDTMFQNKSGAAPRLAILAAMLKPKVIYMVGIDGQNLNLKTKHSFDKNQIGGRDGWEYKIINDHHVAFSKYIHSMSNKMDIDIYNLGEGHMDNASTDYSKANYPLTEHIKERLNS